MSMARTFEVGILVSFALCALGVVGATVVGVWYAATEYGLFWGFLSLGLGGALWAIILDALYTHLWLDEGSAQEHLTSEMMTPVEADDGRHA